MKSHAVAVAALLALAACTTRTVVVRDEPPPPAAAHASTAATLGVPPGHLPPPGRCRIWIPGRPPGHQARSRSCSGIAADAPPGSWILYRPDRDRDHVHVRHVHDRRAGVVVRISIYEAGSGKHVRDERP